MSGAKASAASLGKPAPEGAGKGAELMAAAEGVVGIQAGLGTLAADLKTAGPLNEDVVSSLVPLHAIQKAALAAMM